MATLFFRHASEPVLGMSEFQAQELRKRILRHAIIVLTDGFGLSIGADFVRNIVRKGERDVQTAIQ